MILIADSGSTKTDWRLVDDEGNVSQYSTIGFNPYFQTSDQIADEIKRGLVPYIKEPGFASSDFELYFYGSGCSNFNRSKLVEKALKHNFPKAEVEVNHDLLAAARALCGSDEGIAAILGTGSNSCYYNGKEITENVPSLGFIFGDEGSGTHIGKKFAKSYMKNELPKALAEKFYEQYQLNKDDILEKVYMKPMPNKFLASFCTFVSQNMDERCMFDIVSNCFTQFFELHICKYPKHKQVKFNCVGSVGFYFSDPLKKVAEQKGVSVGKIIDTPIADLVKYHTET